MKTNNKYKRNSEQITYYDAFNIPLLGGVDMQVARVYRIGADKVKRILVPKKSSIQPPPLSIVVDDPVYWVFKQGDPISYDDSHYILGFTDNFVQFLTLGLVPGPLPNLIDELIPSDEFFSREFRMQGFFQPIVKKDFVDNSNKSVIQVIINETMALALGLGYYEDYECEIDFADYGGDIYGWGYPSLLAQLRNERDAQFGEQTSNARNARRMTSEAKSFADISPQELARLLRLKK